MSAARQPITPVLRRSITQLTEDSPLTRQTMTKHLKVLEVTGLVQHVRQGCEHVFELCPEPIDGLKAYLDPVSRQ